jgi:hypothetical protein
VQERPLNTDQQHSISNLEPEYCHDFLAWVKKYYVDVPYLKMHINQLMRQNKELEEDNRKLKAEEKNAYIRRVKGKNIMEIYVGHTYHT